MNGSPPAHHALRAARTERGWSQSETARRLRDVAAAHGATTASAASLKTQLSRWENGHALPEPEYRALLAELYDRTADELGLTTGPDADEPDGADRLRAALAAAAAVDDAVIRLWHEQLSVAVRLDDELGAAGAGELTRALVAQLDHTLTHTVALHRRADVAAVLAAAADLAGRQALDRGDPDAAWQHHRTAWLASHDCASPLAAIPALAGQAAVLCEIGEPAAAIELLHLAPPAPGTAAQVGLTLARALARAVLGDADAARDDLDAADRWLPVIDVIHPPAGLAIEVADLQRQRGHTLLALRDPAAIAPLEDALAAAPRSVRHRAALHADLAMAFTEAGRADDAAPHARAARRLGDRIGSARVVAQVRGLS